MWPVMDDGGGDRMWKVGEWDAVSGAGERGWWGRWDEVAAVSDIRLYSTVPYSYLTYWDHRLFR